MVLKLQDNKYNDTEESMELLENERSEKIRGELDLKLSHLPDEIKDTFMELFVSQKVVALLLRDLRPTSVPYRHQFEITDEKPVYHSARRMAPKHYDEIQK